MLSYLVTSEVRRSLLKVLWLDGLSGSVSELSRLAGVGFASAHKELFQMAEAKLALSWRDGNAVCYRANFEHSHAVLLKKLLAADTGGNVEHDDGDLGKVMDEDVQLNLVSYGAPLGMSGTPKKHLTLEATLAGAFRLAHKNATVARVLPVVLFKKRDELNMERLVFFADQLKERQSLGLFLDLTAGVSGEGSFHRYALKLRDQRVSHVRDFFTDVTGLYSRQLAERNTPQAAKRWHFRMNMGLDVFKTLFDKFCPDVA